ncbi:MAG: DEAD/DEAH box helicase [Rhodospirillales bacterium]
MTFSDLGLNDELLRAVADAGYEQPTPIQEQAIPQVLMGRDILGCAQTGTGKTASFTLPMIEILAAGRAKARMPRSLILEPTRELAAQVAENFDIYGKYHRLSKALLIGGTSMDDQIRIIDRGVDVLIATPGRLLDLFDRGMLLLTDVKTLVIDEADRMLDMGFIPDVEKIVGFLSPIRQTLFFSATMPPEIKKLADKFLINPKEITVAPPSTPAATVTQGLIMVNTKNERTPSGIQKLKREALREIMKRENVKNALIFCNRKRDVSIVCRSLNSHGFDADQLHGDMSQHVRTETLARFKNNEISLLVCSDVAARGLDVESMSHVFNFDVPTHAEDYIHRIGRTGRAGREGRAFMIATEEDTKYIDLINKLMGKPIPNIDLGPLTSAPNTQSDDAGDLGNGENEQRGGKPRRGRKRQQRSKQNNDRDNKSNSRRENDRGDQKPQRKSPSKQRDDTPDEPVVGLGEHMPAFLQEPPKAKAAKAKRKPSKRAPRKKKQSADKA